MSIITTASGAVLPPGSVPPVATLPPGKVTVTVESAPGENDGIEGATSENVVAKCVYPDGFTKNHQTNSPQDLAVKVLNTLRSRYGVAEVNVTKLPEQVVAGATIELEV